MTDKYFADLEPSIRTFLILELTGLLVLYSCLGAGRWVVVVVRGGEVLGGYRRVGGGENKNGGETR